MACQFYFSKPPVVVNKNAVVGLVASCLQGTEVLEQPARGWRELAVYLGMMTVTCQGSGLVSLHALYTLWRIVCSQDDVTCTGYASGCLGRRQRTEQVLLLW